MQSGLDQRPDMSEIELSPSQVAAFEEDNT